MKIITIIYIFVAVSLCSQLKNVNVDENASNCNYSSEKNVKIQNGYNNYFYNPYDKMENLTLIDSNEVSIFATPNDPDYNNQWALSKISIPRAWNIQTGSNNIKVGIIDSGIDVTHPELTNVVDQSLSKDFSPGTNDPFLDRVGHGTFIAGIIGAKANDNIGISGICWNIKLVSLKVTNYETYTTTPIVHAVNYATQNNIDILVLSSTSEEEDYNLTRAIKKYPGLVVCAAGNEGVNIDDNPRYPASNNLDNIITVGATNENDSQMRIGNMFTPFKKTNYGVMSVDLFAPGVGILSTYPLSIDSDGYYTDSGTSYAAPYVAGVAALILSQYPTASSVDIKNTLISNVDNIEHLSNYCVSGGRLNAFKPLTIHTNHMYSYKYVDRLVHVLTCMCGLTTGDSQNHSVTEEDAADLIATCLGCGHILDLSYDVAIVQPSSIDDNILLSSEFEMMTEKIVKLQSVKYNYSEDYINKKEDEDI